METTELKRILTDWTGNLRGENSKEREEFFDDIGLGLEERELVNCAIDKGLHLLLAFSPSLNTPY